MKTIAPFPRVTDRNLASIIPASTLGYIEITLDYYSKTTFNNISNIYYVSLCNKRFFFLTKPMNTAVPFSLIH